MLTKIQNPRLNYFSRLLALPILAATVLAFTLRTEKVVVNPTKLEKPITVVIDAGHGIMPNGKPNGVAIDNFNEDDIVLAIASKIKELNKNDRLKIVLTRTTDKIVDLHKRVDIAKENNADLFVSLHIDAYMENANPDLSSNQSLKNGFGIYVSNKQPAYQAQSEKLGSALTEELNTIYPTNPYLLKRKVGVWVLDQNICPSVLVECGFLTDKNDKAFITKQENQNAVAERILKAIERYALSQQSNNDLDTIPKNQPVEMPINKQDKNGKDQALPAGFNAQKNPLFIVNGKEVNRSDLDHIGAEDIESISVIKDGSLIKKYGEKAKDGVIEIKLKEPKGFNELADPQKGKTGKVGEGKIDPARYSFNATNHSADTEARDTVPADKIEGRNEIKELRSGKTVIESDLVSFQSHGKGNNALIIFNGKEMQSELLEGKQIISKKIVSYEENNAEAIKLYGSEAKRGVIIFEDAQIKNLPVKN